MLADYSQEAWDHLPREEVDALQLTGLKQRFAQPRDAIPMLKKLADAEDVDSIDNFNDVVPLLFDHTIYKSYPPSLLENNRFQHINKWLAKLTLHPVEEVDVSHCSAARCGVNDLNCMWPTRFFAQDVLRICVAMMAS